MERRNFLKTTAASGVALTGLAGVMNATAGEAKVSNSAKFKLKYAPGLGTFSEHAGKDPIDNIKFMADQGFTALFDNGLMRKPAELQEKIANELARQGMELGPFVLYADFKTKSFVTQKPEIKEMLKDTMQKGLEVPGDRPCPRPRADEGLEQGYQMANIIDNLRMCCDIVGPTGLELVMEPLNAWTNHPGLILTKMPEAYMLCVAVNHPSCKIVNDMYHQQITEGNIIPNIDKCWDHIGAFHIGDNPGRKEPGTGEINYLNIFKHIYDKGYDGVLCCEHGKSIRGKEGEKAFIEAYRKVDAFEV